LRVRFLNLTVKASPKGQKVILTIRDSDEKWWESWCRFNEQEIRRDAIGSFNTRMILLRAAEIGYMGPQFRFIIIYRLYNIAYLKYIESLNSLVKLKVFH